MVVVIQPMYLHTCLDSYLSVKANGMLIRCLEVLLKTQTYANGYFLDLILPLKHILKVYFVNFAPPPPSESLNSLTLESAREKSKSQMKK